MENGGVSLVNYLESLRMRYAKAIEDGADADELEYLHSYIDDVEEHLRQERKSFMPEDFETFSVFCGCFDSCYNCPLLLDKLTSGRACKCICKEKIGEEEL